MLTDAHAHYEQDKAGCLYDRAVSIAGHLTAISGLLADATEIDLRYLPSAIERLMDDYLAWTGDMVLDLCEDSLIAAALQSFTSLSSTLRCLLYRRPSAPSALSCIPSLLAPPSSPSACLGYDGDCIYVAGSPARRRGLVGRGLER
eukprot:709335-Pyramimonas_sp.AAC.1